MGCFLNVQKCRVCYLKWFKRYQLLKMSSSTCSKLLKHLSQANVQFNSVRKHEEKKNKLGLFFFSINLFIFFGLAISLCQCQNSVFCCLVIGWCALWTPSRTTSVVQQKTNQKGTLYWSYRSHFVTMLILYYLLTINMNYIFYSRHQWISFDA